MTIEYIGRIVVITVKSFALHVEDSMLTCNRKKIIFDMTAKKRILITAQNVSLYYSSKRVLYSINMDIYESELVTIIGPNGSGKTSLIKIIAGLIKPSSGTIRNFGDLTISYMPQLSELNLIIPINVINFLNIFSKNKDNIEDVMTELNISHIRYALLSELSGGELQKVVFAKCILQRPNLMILDEPINSMDVIARSKFYKIVNMICDSGCTVMMVSHDLHAVVCNTDRVICLNGHICCEGNPNDYNVKKEMVSIFGDTNEDIILYRHDHNHEHK